jgi:hypothetical protein
MAAVALVNLKGRYVDGRVALSWGYPPGAPETVHIYPVKRRGAADELDMRRHISKDLRDCPTGITFEYDDASDGDVKKREFCVYLSEHGDMSPDAKTLFKSQDFRVTVSIGEADVHYDIRTKKVDNGLKSCVIRLQSSAEIDPEILGYSFDFNGQEIMVSFPERIYPKKTEYPPIYLPEHSHPEIRVVSGENADVSVTPKKISMRLTALLRIFKRK